MKLLVVSPDYLSHYLPLSALAGAARRREIDVVVATGDSMRPRVEADGCTWRSLPMSRGSNPGLLSDRLDGQAATDDLAAFFTATTKGMIATLSHQARERDADLLWEPETVAMRVVELVDREDPDAIVVDHLAFTATLALRALERPFTTFVPGHPTQLPNGREIYGYAESWPRCIEADPDGLAELRRLCQQATREVTDRYNEVLVDIDPLARPVGDAFAVHGDDVLFNSVDFLGDPQRSAGLPDRHAFLGGCVRSEIADRATASWIRSLEDRSFVYVSLGTFLSARTDVLRRIVWALRGGHIPVALSTGTTARSDLGPVPRSWLVAPSLPQVALLEQAAAVITHGGNNTVTEALATACPTVVLPFSTDQFAVAADLERCRLGLALDPNRATASDIADATNWALSSAARTRAAEVAATLRSRSGPDVAIDRLQVSVASG